MSNDKKCGLEEVGECTCEEERGLGQVVRNQSLDTERSFEGINSQVKPRCEEKRLQNTTGVAVVLLQERRPRKNETCAEYSRHLASTCM